MPEAKLFKCPSCGSALSAQGDAAEIKCQYCGNTVIVPESLRTAAPDEFVSHTYPSSAGGPGIGLLGAVVGVVVVLIVVGVIGMVLAGSLLGSSPAAPLAAGPTVSPTPAGFAHVVLSFGGEGTGPGLFQDARHVAADPSGNIYAEDYRTKRVQKFDPTGKYVGGWTVDAKLCSNSSATLNTIAADRNGNVYVEFCGEIVKYDGATGKMLADYNGDKNKPRVFYMDLALYPDGGLLVLADGAPSAQEVVLRLDADGKVLAQYPNLVSEQTGKDAVAGNLEPALDGLGNIFLLNGDDYAIYKFTPDGKYVNRFGSVGKAASQFDVDAQNLAVDNQSRVYVTDFSGIKVFDSNGTYLESMSDRFVNGGIEEMRITEKNEIYVISSKDMIYKLVRNTP